MTTHMLRHLCALFAMGIAGAVRVASLSAHDAASWSTSSGCLSSAANTTRCNLEVYASAAVAAASLGAELILYPEAYGLASIKDEFEPFISPIGTKLSCGVNTTSTSVQQGTLACLAQQHNLTVAANVFTSLSNGTKRIMQIVYDRSGTVISTYSKHHLVPYFETRYAEPGPFAPTTFDHGGMRWGIIICFEGVYPELTKDWSQLDALKTMGAGAFLWSIGGMVPQRVASDVLARKYAVTVAASELKKESQFFDASGARMPQTSQPVAVEGYTAPAAIVVADVAQMLL